MNAEELEKLKIEKKYDQIYEQFGSEIYLKNIPLKYKLSDIKRLINQGKFNVIYEKYGEETYLGYLSKIEKRDIKNELGITPINIKIKFGLKKQIKKGINLVKHGVIITGVIFTTLTLAEDSNIKESREQYATEIEDYNKKVNEYADSIKKLNLSDIEIITKVVDDMWNNIDGYGAPKDEVTGYWRLNLKDKQGVGVCRNMADDVTAKLNAINPEYKATNLNVYMFGNECEVNNTERRFAKGIDIVNNESNSLEESSILNDLLVKTIGNHMVTIAYLKNDNITIIIDSTNPSIGVLKDGKIYLLSDYMESKESGLKAAPIGLFVLGSENTIDVSKKYFLSLFQNPNLGELKNKYGIDVQNEILYEEHNKTK